MDDKAIQIPGTPMDRGNGTLGSDLDRLNGEWVATRTWTAMRSPTGLFLATAIHEQLILDAARPR